MPGPSHLRFQLETYEPGARQPCLCGSGLRFRDCCQGKYGLQSYAKARAFIAQSDFRKALPELRGHLTWYRLSHLAHTAAVLPSKNPAILHLLEIDIAALFEITERLMFCYRELGTIHEFPAVLTELEPAIADPRWLAKMTYLRALYLSNFRSKAAAWKVITKSRLLSSLDDVELLSVAIEAAPADFPTEDRIALANRIITATNDADYRLHYRALKGILTVVELNDPHGIDDLLGAIEDYEKLATDQRSAYGEWQLGNCLSFAARLADRDDLASRAITHFQQCLPKPEYNAAARAGILCECGESYLQLRDLHKARACYEASLHEKDDVITRIYLIRARVGLKEFGAASDALEEIDIQKLRPSGQVDLGIAWVELALATRQPVHKAKALSILQSLQHVRGLFEKMRLALIAELKEERPAPSEPPPFLRRLFTRYLTIQPNWLGLGINLNAVIADLFPEKDPSARNEGQDHKQ